LKSQVWNVHNFIIKQGVAEKQKEHASSVNHNG